jgi:ParB-like chromosome segregation protein Spo0J
MDPEHAKAEVIATGFISPQQVVDAYEMEDHNFILSRVNAKELEDDIKLNGIKEPVLLGFDGKVWDGQLRTLIALKLGIKEITFKKLKL